MNLATAFQRSTFFEWRYGLVLALITLLCGPQSFAADEPNQPSVEAGPRPLLVLESPAERDSACRRVLLRELIRQAFLITAREEFGLATRDAVLREPSDDKIPDLRAFRLDVELHDSTKVKVQLRVVGNVETLSPWTMEFEAVGEKQLETALTLAEGWSRRDFVNWLDAANVPREPQLQRDSLIDLTSPVPLDFVSQLGVLRKLHTAYLSDPKSPKLAAKLAEHYAILGSLTEVHWGGEHKVFKARSLLYAERAVQHAPDDATVAWTKSLALALCGREDLAAIEIERATPLSVPETTPAWAESIRQYVQWDQAGLAGSVKKQRPLAAYFAMRAAEMTGSSNQRIAAASAVRKVAPECFRAMATLANEKELGLRRSMGDTQLQRFLIAFPQQVAQLPGLPQTVRDGTNKSLFSATNKRVFEHTVTLIKRLNQATLIDDRSEPSLAIVATLASNLHFIHVIQQLYTEQFMLGIDASSSAKRFTPLLSDHPAKGFVNAYQSDGLKAQQAYIDTAPALLTSTLSEASWPTIKWFRWLMAGEIQGNLEQRIRAGREDVVADLLAKLNDDISDAEKREALLVLQRITPRCPGLVAWAVKLDWAAARAQAAAWIEQSDNPQVLVAIGEQYDKTADENLDDRQAAERCWKKLIQIEPSHESYHRLVNHYHVCDDQEAWKDALLRTLDLPDRGLDIAKAHQQLADWYMDRQKWQQALPHAKAAAQSYSSWGLLCGARCLEGLEKWDEAEKLVRANAERYESEWITWYLWCQRTGRGDSEAALENCESTIAKMSDPQRRAFQSYGIHLQLKGDLAGAAEAYRSRAESDDPSGYWAIHAMLMYEQLQRFEDRDKLITRLNERGAPFALVFSQQLQRPADDSPARLSEADLEFCFGYGGVFDDATNAAYFIGRMLEMRGRNAEAIRWYQRAAASPDKQRWTSALAAIEVRRLGAVVPPPRSHMIDEPLVEAFRLTTKGVRYRNQDRLDLANKTIDLAIEAAPNWTVSLFCKANVIKRQGQHAAAEVLFTRVLEQLPHQPMVFAFRGEMRDELGKKSAAEEDYRAAVTLVPNYTYAKVRLDKLLSGPESGK